MSNNQQEFSTDLLRIYYGRLFPYEAFFNWLSYGNDPTKDNDVIEKDFFSKREFSFTIEDDIYIRYQSFNDMNELKLAIQKRQPHKIDIGAVFSAQPKDHMTIKADAFKTVERELVFDIDMTDYDNIRTCCTGANICLRCWPYMTMAIKVVDRTLREDFGYHHILWVYSGRRGVHCWVCDMSARELSNEARSAVVDYMSVELSSEKHGRSLNLHHPMIRRSYAILEPYFEKYIADGKLGQGLLESWDSYATILNTMPDDRVRQELSDKCERRQKRGEEYSGEERWRDLKEATSALSHGLDTKKRKLYAELEDWRINLVLTHCYPRLDANVSKMQNHLLKSPFCVHPKTGRVCVPIDPSMADEFNPFDVPTIRTLCHQIDEYDNSHDPSDLRDIDKTDMKYAMQCFDKTLMTDLITSIRKNFREKYEKRAAMDVDF